MLCFCQTLLHIQGRVGRGIVVVKEPIAAAPHSWSLFLTLSFNLIPYPTAFPYGNGMVLHFYQQQESSTTKTVHKVINKGLKAYV